MQVLVYVDPAPRGEWALALARQLPGAGHALHLVATAEDAAADPTLLDRAAAGLAGVARRLTRPGPAERAVVQEALERRYDLLLVPPAGRGALARMLKGSRVASVVRSVRAPVLVARRPPPRVERVLAALSGRPATAAVVEAALAWEAAGARAGFLHVRPEVALPFTGPAAGEPGAPAASPDTELARAALAAHGRGSELALREGAVVDELLDAFEAGAFHLLVIGARAAAEASFGREDITERLLLACPGSTLVVPAGDGR
jgi:nucleotide-binding universal stress UspA family protein